MGSRAEVRLIGTLFSLLESDCHSATAGGILNGGSGGLVWTYVGSYFAFGTIVLSLAEMASM